MSFMWNFLECFSITTLLLLALMHLSKLLNNVQYGYKMFNQNINHLIYIDSAAAEKKKEQSLQDLLAIIKQFRNGIKGKLRVTPNQQDIIK